MRKFFILLLVANSSWLTASSQYWQQQANFLIDVTLNDKDHTLDGFEKIIYTNNSPDTLKFIWFHLWANAYKNDKTAFSDQMLENGDTRFYFSSKEDKGYINRLDFRVNDISAKLEDHPQHIDIAKLILPFPLPPNETITITTPFHVKLPFNFSRGGHVGQSYQCTQWYPKPAVYDHKGWHPMPYLDQGEFYSEFGNSEVKITVPSNYVVAASGKLMNEDERQWLMERKNFTWEPIKKKVKNSKGIVETKVQEFPESVTTTKTLIYKQILSHDFAWFADKRFIVNYEQVHLPSDKTVDVFSFYTPQEKPAWSKSLQFAKDAVLFYSDAIDDCPYNTISVVQGPESFGGGMEYPGITVISPMQDEATLDKVIAHEIGHNWFYGALASNERMHPWMDEGMNSFYEQAYTFFKKHKNDDAAANSLLETVIANRLDQPIETPSENFSDRNYGLIAYMKAAQWMQLLEKELGKDGFKKAMKEYWEQWKFKHPYPEDFKKSMEKSSGKNLDSIFSLLKLTGTLNNEPKKGFALQNIIKAAMQANSKKKTVITWLPVFGYNSYDKLLAGLGFTNTTLPPTKFQFLAIPMYGVGSKKFNGIGVAWNTFYTKGLFRKIEPGISFSKFTQNKYENSEGRKAYLSFTKIVPGIRFTFNEKNPRNTKLRYIQWKTFLINEDGLRFFRDTIFTPPSDTTVFTNFAVVEKKRTLNQLKIVVEDYRALYPYSGELKIEQGKDFVRSAFTGNYFFNYPKKGGLNVRLFAGKFFYTGGKTFSKEFSTDRYHLNMTGANGYEDYTYSDYFIGRNQFEGFESQQIMNRDGGFKIRTDLLAAKVGRTDDWLASLNFSTTIPDDINPLNLLPVKIPLKLFADIGTFAEAWDKDAEIDRFLFDAGLHIPILKETINIYVPLIYSSVFKDYIESTLDKKGRFFKKISFTIDISNFNLRKFDRNLSF